MERFIARQPIFDWEKNIFGYQLLFRNSLDNYFSGCNLDEASSEVIANSFLLFSIEEMTDDSRAFLKATHHTIKSGYISALPPQAVVIEIMQPLVPDPELVIACGHLKAAGYTLALDDFIFDDNIESLLNYIDIVKFDTTSTSLEDCQDISDELHPRGIKLLATKVESYEAFHQLQNSGVDYFQGYFFSKPTVLSRKDIPANTMKYVQILQQVNAPEIDYEKLADTIQGEMSVAYKLLKLINSAAFGLPKPVHSIKQALALLGGKELRKWVSLISMTGMASDKPNQLVINSLARGKSCELLAPHVGMVSRAPDLFLMGLFSMLDGIIDRSLNDVLNDIPFEEDLKDALLGKPGHPRKVLDLVLAQEMGLWRVLGYIADSLRLKENTLQEIYIEALKWAEETFKA
ncbi:EAL and modified HD-GYP domain-containing signal transduction protein [Malonomonas rubra DSM 5091]|uniref:EAL and modified HD-GYP domain-containing signal transduction protein n=1 Tax=Malonomonas rubra DSM 5091 TaxID=1122189 RepID=A0A1M6C3I2_MALRU|nr:HDOD domain-containing protein [Malonomonas rubra]SHI55576.1 EAL and modified HD-GYP domain-containing signal transduction protein [Malonomonas rubra DSM 5091]